MIAVNINDRVRVKLSGVGHMQHKLYYAALGLSPPTIQEDAEGFSTWQIWALMKIFGNRMTLGLNPPFDPTIYLPETEDNYPQKLDKLLKASEEAIDVLRAIAKLGKVPNGGEENGNILSVIDAANNLACASDFLKLRST